MFVSPGLKPFTPQNNPLMPNGPVVIVEEPDDGMMRVSKPTEAERAMLEKLGWKEGDMLPRDVASKAATGDIDQVKNYIENRRIETEQQEQERLAMPQNPAPGAAQALQQIRHGNVPQVEIEDDLAEKLEPAKEATAETLETAANDSVEFCPRCNWKVSEKDTVEVTNEDKQNYIVAIGGLLPFSKTYKLLGGNLELTVRDLTMPERDLCANQVFYDQQAGKIHAVADVIEKYRQYRVVLQLVRLVTPNFVFANKGADSPDLKSVEGETILPALAERIYGKVLRSDSVYNVVANALDSFNWLVRKLEANVYSPDFWETTSSSS